LERAQAELPPQAESPELPVLQWRTTVTQATPLGSLPARSPRACSLWPLPLPGRRSGWLWAREQASPFRNPKARTPTPGEQAPFRLATGSSSSGGLLTIARHPLRSHHTTMQETRQGANANEAVPVHHVARSPPCLGRTHACHTLRGLILRLQTTLEGLVRLVSIQHEEHLFQPALTSQVLLRRLDHDPGRLVVGEASNARS
jgi:hypothetical protein